MKVKVMQRCLYYKYAEIEVEVPKDIDTQDWLMDNEEKWSGEIDEATSKAEYHFGNGMDSYDWTDDDDRLIEGLIGYIENNVI